MNAKRVWRVRSRPTGYEWEGVLEAVWEVFLDPISDNYTFDEITADELFDLWIEQLRKDGDGDLISIYWYVACYREGKVSAMPFQFSEEPDLFEDNNFLAEFTWPVNPNTGDRLNWLSLPVIDKLWNENREDKGGFIQQATGWKPSVLQPYVYLPALLAARKG